jgi:hypothetical protein
MANLLPFAMVNQIRRREGIPRRESHSTSVGISLSQAKSDPKELFRAILDHYGLVRMTTQVSQQLKRIYFKFNQCRKQAMRSTE